jgi:hypothetical protein
VDQCRLQGTSIYTDAGYGLQPIESYCNDVRLGDLRGRGLDAVGASNREYIVALNTASMAPISCNTTKADTSPGRKLVSVSGTGRAIVMAGPTMSMK